MTPNPYLPLIYQAADKYGVPRDLAVKMVRQESGFHPNVVSGAGASGLTQLMPATAKELGVTNVFDPAQNIFGGVKYLGEQLAKYQSPALALAAYNAGPGRTDELLQKGRPLPAETQNYVKSIMGSSMANYPQPALTSSAAANGPGALSGGGQQPSYDLGKHLQNAAAWLETIYNPAAAAGLLKAVNDPLNRTHFGLNPLFMRDPTTGAVVPYQLNTAGGASRLNLPGTPVLPVTVVNGGNKNYVLQRGETTPSSVLPVNGKPAEDEIQVQTPNGVQYQPAPNSKLSQQIQPREKRKIGQTQLNTSINTLVNAYTQLYKKGGAVDSSVTGLSGAAHNTAEYIANTPLGQLVGKIHGNPLQDYRTVIGGARPLIIDAIKQATGMGAKQLDSNVELDFYLRAASDPTNSYQSNMAILDALDRTYGLGLGLKNKLPPAVYRKVQEMSGALLKEHPLTMDNSTENDSANNGITITRIK